MLDSIVLDTFPPEGGTRSTTLHHVDSATRAVARASGLFGWPGPRSAVTPRTEQHGDNDRSRYLEGKVITLEGEVWNATPQAAEAEFDAIEQAMFETLRVPGLLKWVRANGGLALQAYVKFAGGDEPVLEEGAAMLRYMRQLRQSDPRAYSQALTTAVGNALTVGGGGLVFPEPFPWLFTSSGGGDAAVVNSGIAPTPPLIRVYGYATAPEIVLLTTGERVKLTGEIGVGEYFELDHAARTVRLGGQTDRMSLFDDAASSFFEIPPGTHTVRLLSGNFDAAAKLEVDTRGAYAG